MADRRVHYSRLLNEVWVQISTGWLAVSFSVVDATLLLIWTSWGQSFSSNFLSQYQNFTIFLSLFTRYDNVILLFLIKIILLIIHGVYISFMLFLQVWQLIIVMFMYFDVDIYHVDLCFYEFDEPSYVYMSMFDCGNMFQGTTKPMCMFYWQKTIFLYYLEDSAFHNDCYNVIKNYISELLDFKTNIFESIILDLK